MITSRSITLPLYTHFPLPHMVIGRTYLSGNPELMSTLMDSLKRDREDNLTRENILGCLQKLSLRRSLQTMMISKGW